MEKLYNILNSDKKDQWVQKNYDDFVIVLRTSFK